MDPLHNPFSPGAGARPPALVGRDPIIRAAEVALHRIQRGRPEKSQMLLGLRGVGKTVLLNRIGEMAEGIDYRTISIEAPEGQRLAEYLAPALKSALLAFSRTEKARDMAARGLAALRGFASAFKISIGEIGIEVTEPSAADSGNLEIDLPELLVSVGRAAASADASVVILLDEVQYLSEEDLRALIVSMHRMSQLGLPVVLFGAGLPQVAGLAGAAKSYAERLFDYPGIGPLDSDAAAAAIRNPVEAEGESIENEALSQIVEATHGYPYFLQEWGKHSWNEAD